MRKVAGNETVKSEKCGVGTDEGKALRWIVVAHARDVLEICSVQDKISNEENK